MKSTSKPMSNEDFTELKETRDTPEGKVDKNVTPHYGLKEHASVDVDNGFILATALIPASEYDSNYLPYLTIASCHTKNSIKKVY